MVPRACYECGDPGHLRRTCPRLRGKAVQQGQQPQTPAPAAQPPRGGGHTGKGRPRGGGQTGRDLGNLGHGFGIRGMRRRDGEILGLFAGAPPVAAISGRRRWAAGGGSLRREERMRRERKKKRIMGEMAQNVSIFKS
ncbi:PREDICTED: uncharacterized protein LOC109217732 [Nicotiana attenuata]|uniref:uncharacterized protein LOC109217732 n=1 Tax=Nicotiana attenuata TaxID=49451 RepID=UPI0009052453|nr:PREDICTED: uncharacterized protein LOC109217732 [Nicotiana attenuata]